MVYSTGHLDRMRQLPHASSVPEAASAHRTTQLRASNHKTGISSNPSLLVGTHVQYCPVKVIRNYSKKCFHILFLN